LYLRINKYIFNFNYKQLKTIRIYLFFWILICSNISFLFSQQISQTDSVIVVFGDTRSNPEVHRTVVNKIMLYKPLAVFHTGDLVFNGSKKSAWVTFEEIEAPIIKNSRLYPCYGNHELHSKIMSRDFALPNNGKWYSVDIGNCHFVVIDNFSDYTKGSEQYQWIENDLNNCPPGKFRMVIMHLPVYSSGPHNTQNKKIRKYLVPLFEKYKVSFVFSAHNHCYEKAYSHGIYYITTAGGGAPFYKKSKDIPESQFFINTYHFCTLKNTGHTLHLEAIDTNLRVIDKIEVKQP